MTVQASDSFIFKRKKYVLIDVEIGKQIIDCADFHMPEHNPSFWTAGWIGYAADYKGLGDKMF